MKKWISLAVALLAAVGPASARADFVTVSLDSIANVNLQSYVDSGYPSGTPVTLGGVPFDLPANVVNTWAPYAVFSGSGLVTTTLNVSIYGVDAVHTLINTFWGVAGPNSYASIRFIGDGGADFTYNLIGNVDIRDYNQNV